MKSIPWQLWAAVGAVGLFWMMGRNAASVGASVGEAVVDGASGVVLGIGDGLGIPRTDRSECQRALADGRMWDASFACPAGSFISGGWDRIKLSFNGA